MPSCLEALDGLLPGSIRSDPGLDEDAKGIVAEVRAFCRGSAGCAAAEVKGCLTSLP